MSSLFGRVLSVRRAVILAAVVLTAVVSVSVVTTTPPGTNVCRSMLAVRSRTEIVANLAGAQARLVDAAVHGLEMLQLWDDGTDDGFVPPKEEEAIVYEGVVLDEVLNFALPQTKLAAQLKPGVRYVTTLAFGGHGNQMVAIGNLLYLAKLLKRVAIIPTLLPIHFQARPANFSEFYDLPRFHHNSGIPAITFSSVKPVGPEGTPPNEGLSCWSVQEATTGIANYQTHSFDAHQLWVDPWGLPFLSRAIGGHDISFDAIRIFDFDVKARWEWIAKSQKEFLPQKSLAFTGDVESNLKDAFDPVGSPTPSDQLLCFDNTLFVGPIIFPESYTTKIPLEPDVPGEGLAWTGAMQHIRFTPHVEKVADEYLMKLFNVSISTRIPPFLSVHFRRGDFASEHGLMALGAYERAVARLVVRLQVRLDNPEGWRGPGKKAFQSFGIRASEYRVVTTTDEPEGSPFINEIRQLGWLVLDHAAFKTAEKHGGWFPTIVDSAVLARGQGFVGTDKSTFTYLAGLRVKYWRGGMVEIALP